MLRFGIIGYGYMGHIHAASLQKIQGAHLVAVCDINPRMLLDAPADVACYNQAETLLTDRAVDVVIIAANNNQHKKLVCLAAEAGKQIICEKPAALDVGELDEMIQTVARCKVNFTVHQQRRLDKDFQTALAICSGGELGDLYTIKSTLYGYNGALHDWHVHKAEGGGMLYDWGVHLLDQMLQLVPGKIRQVYADLKSVINADVDDYFNIILQFENGLNAQIELGTYYLSDNPGWFSRHWFIGGNRGCASFDGMNPVGRIVRTARIQGKPVPTTDLSFGPTRSFGPPPDGLIQTEPLPAVSTSHLDFFDNYLSASRGETAFLVKIQEVRRVLLLMETIRQSAASGLSIEFE